MLFQIYSTLESDSEDEPTTSQNIDLLHRVGVKESEKYDSEK